MKKKTATNPKSRIQIAIAIGIAVVVIAIFINYYFDQARLKGQSFGDNLASLQSDLKNETQSFDSKLTMYENGQISKNDMLNMTDSHISKMQGFLTKYDDLNPPESFAPSLQLFRLSTQTQLESDQYLKKWIESGDNATRQKSDELLQQSFHYEINALQSFNNAKSNGS